MHVLEIVAVIAVLGYGCYMLISHGVLHDRLSSIEEAVISLDNKLKKLAQKL